MAIKLWLVMAVLGAGLVLGEDCLGELVGVLEEITVPPCEGFDTLTIIAPVSLTLKEVLLRLRDLFLLRVDSEYGCE